MDGGKYDQTPEGFTPTNVYDPENGHRDVRLPLPPLPFSNASQVYSVAVGPQSVKLVCPICRVTVTTKVNAVSQRAAHIACFVLCILGCCLCSCIPYCMKSFKDVHHFCPQCNTFIGTYKH